MIADVPIDSAGLSGTFFLYAIVTLLAFVFIYGMSSTIIQCLLCPVYVPETKGKPLEIVAEEMERRAAQGWCLSPRSATQGLLRWPPITELTVV